MAFQTCCWRFSLRTGCMIIGALGLGFDVLLLVLSFHWIFILISVISNGLLIAAVKMGKYFDMLPWIALNILQNVVLWFLEIVFLASEKVFCKIIVRMGVPERSFGGFTSSLIFIIFATIAIIQIILIKVVYDHFVELRAEKHRARSQHDNFRSVPVPTAPDASELF